MGTQVYYKKPTIEALEWTGDNVGEMERFTFLTNRPDVDGTVSWELHGALTVTYKNGGKSVAHPGDYVIRSQSDGWLPTFEVCSRELFEALFAPIPF